MQANVQVRKNDGALIKLTSNPATPPVYARSLAARTSGVSGTNDGTGRTARFYRLSGIVADVAGNLDVTDSSNKVLRKIE